jgi:hypothetical protein
VAVTGTVPDGDRRDGELVDRAYDGPGDWLDVRQACVRLGISERSLYRRINAGRLTRRPSQGGGIEVYVPPSGTPPEAPPDESGALPDGDALLLVERIVSPFHQTLGDLIRRNAELERENGRLQARLGELERRLTPPDTTAAPWWRRTWLWLMHEGP